MDEFCTLVVVVDSVVTLDAAAAAAAEDIGDVAVGIIFGVGRSSAMQSI